ncbi:MAG: ABC transporter permease [Solirubrobacteraceae bacterium]
MRQIALRGLRARPLRTALTALAVVLGVALIAATYIFTDTIDRSISEVFAEANSGTDVVISPRTVDEDFFDDPPPLDERLVERVRAVEGVTAAAGGIFGDVSIRAPDGDPVGSQSFVSSLQPPPFEQFRFVTGRAPRADSEIGLDRDTFEQDGFELGDRVRIVGDEGARSFRLVGAARFGESASIAGFPVAIATLPAAQALTDQRGRVGAISVAAADGVAPPQLRGRVRAALQGKPVTVRTGEEDASAQAADLQEQFGFLRTALLVFGGIALFVGAFVIYNTFSITVAQRTRELALLRMLGASRRQVLRSVVLEAAVVGLIASLAGLAAGFALVPALRALLQATGADLPATGSVIATRTLVVALLVGVVVTVLASLVPALRATRIAPIAALRDGLTAPVRAGRARLAVAALLCLAGAGVLAYGLAGGGSGGDTAAILGAGSVAIFLGVALLSPQLVRPVAALLGAPLQRLAGISGRLARENATRNPARTAVTAAALMIGVALVVFVSIFAAGLQGSIDRAVDRAFAGDLTVGVKSGFGETPPALAAEVRRVRGVGAVSSVRFSDAKVAGEEGSTTVAGIDPATLSEVYTLRWKQGSDATLGRLGEDGILADSSFSGDARVGDRVALLTPAGKRVSYVIRGLLDEGSDFGLLGGGLVIPNARLRADFDVSDDDFVFVRFAAGADPERTRGAIDRALAASFPDARTRDRGQVKAQQAGQINQVLYLIYALLALSVVVSLFGIVNTLALSIFERTRELGLLRAVGMSRRQVKRIVRLEAVITSLIGALLGLVLGVLFALAMSRPLESEGFRLTFPVATLVLLVAGAAMAGVLAALWPARRAARLDVLRALAYE